MIQLPNGCRRSEFHVFPANWQTAKAKLIDTWYADCRFIDPRFITEYPKGKNIRIKSGINRLKTVSERKVVMKELLKEMEQILKDGYNPITDSEIKTPSVNIALDEDITEVLPSTPFIKALRFSLKVSEYEPGTKHDMRCVLNSLEKAAKELGYLTIPIEDIQVKHIKLSLDKCRALSPEFSAKRFNKAKAYLSSLYRYLVEVGATPGNMAKAVSVIKKIIPTKPVYLTDDEVKRIKEHLWEHNRSFYAFMMMFYYSGGRIIELMRLKVKDVDLNEQKFSSLVLKGQQDWKDRTIRDIALPYWKEHLKGAKPEDYVFSKNLLPGPKQIRNDQIGRRWTKYVMKPLSVKATFYKLKHRSATATNKIAGIELAAAQMGHTTTKMASDTYVIGEKDRIKAEQHEVLKKIDIAL